MKKIIPVALGVVMVTGFLTGCGYSADENTLFILKNGKVVSTDVDEFDTETYSEEEFQEYVNNVIETYNTSYGEDSVTLKKLKIKDGAATVTLQYTTAADYMAFNSIHLFTGSIQEAKDSGFPFNGNFASVKSGDAELCGADEFMDEEAYKVVVLDASQTFNVQVPGKILYVTTDYVKLVNSKKIDIGPEYNVLLQNDSEDLDTENATEAVFTTETGSEIAEEVITTETTETEEEDEEDDEDDAVSDDDLLTSVQESSEEEEDPEEEDEEIAEEETGTPDYIYIIYK